LIKGGNVVKLTVMYNLPPGADHDEFLKWRTGPHQEDNVQLPGLLKTDFYVIQDSREGPDPYRYMTEAYFPDMETFENAFYNPNYQARLQENLKRIAGPLFLISIEVLTAEASGD
jgi:hypothetical protein